MSLASPQVVSKFRFPSRLHWWGRPFPNTIEHLRFPYIWRTRQLESRTSDNPARNRHFPRRNLCSHWSYWWCHRHRNSGQIRHGHSPNQRRHCVLPDSVERSTCKKRKKVENVIVCMKHKNRCVHRSTTERKHTAPSSSHPTRMHLTHLAWRWLQELRLLFR
jgi:hypothetical protein